MPIVQPFSPRAGFVKQGVDGAFALTPEAYRFLRDALSSLGGGNTSSPSDFDVLSQFSDVAAVSSAELSKRIDGEDVRSVMQGSQYAIMAELSKRLDGIEIAMSQYAIMAELSKRLDGIEIAMSQYAIMAELSKRLDGIEIAMAQYADPTALLVETVKWGTYTPTLTNVTNVTASTAFACQYVRLGRMVCVSGQLSIDPTAASTLTEVGLSLPIASDFVGGECSGSAGCSSSDSVAISEDVANNRAKLQLTPTGSADKTYRFVFMYKTV